ncbi:MAG: phosphoesterase PA-phosphatase [Bacilli bacterium]|nr:phosphoesterase PA-phosphatase [Bacilli bacterium]
MKKWKFTIISAILLLVFVVYTVLVKNVDVKAIGPEGSSVGFASLNGWVKDSVGVNFDLYKFTDYFSLIAVPVGAIFAVMGVVQLVKRQKIMKVDANILALGIFYVLTFVAYLAFEVIAINSRPVLIDGVLETSYPSSTTVLSLIIFVTAIDQIVIYIKDKLLRDTLIVFDVTFSLILVVGRIMSGVHWISDIIGGVLLSAVLISIYFTVKNLLGGDKNKVNHKVSEENL